MEENQVEGHTNIRVVHGMRDNGQMTLKMGSGYTPMQIVRGMRGIGSIVRSMGRGRIISRMEMSILVIGSRIRRMAKVFFSISQGRFMMESGLMIKQRIRGRLFIRIKTNTKVIHPDIF